MTVIWFAATVLFLLSVAVRTWYEMRKRTGGPLASSRLAIAVVMIAMFSMWFSWFAMPPLDPLPISLPSAVHVIGEILTWIGVALIVGSFAQHRRLEKAVTLYTRGLFAVVRHPMYTGFIFWLVGRPLVHGAVVSFIAGIAGIIAIVFWTKWEEEDLLEQFGQAYSDYKRRTLF